ncbi:MAG: DNA-methyltransferase [Acidimicrobiia bacterium]
MGTETASFGTGKRESHDASRFYGRGLVTITETDDTTVAESPVRDEIFCQSATSMDQLVDNSVALMITSPPYHVGKEYDSDASFGEYLDLLTEVFAETHRVLEPGGRAVINVANLGRRPYVPLSHLVTQRLLGLGFFMRGEIIWRKGRGANGNCAWGSWRSPANPVVRDVHEYCLVFSKGRFGRAHKGTATISAEDFMASTLSVWEIPSESASRVKHPAPFPVELPRRFIELYTFEEELVLDPFMGSGTTAVAALQTDRHYVGYEIDPDYIQTAADRIRKAIPQRA